MNHKGILVQCAVLVIFPAIPAMGQVTWFVVPGNVVNGDAPFRAAAGPLTVNGFEPCTSNYTPVASAEPDVSIAVIDAHSGQTISPHGWCYRSPEFNQPGRFQGGSLLGCRAPACGWLRLNFESPVVAFGTWVFDDSGNFRNHTRLRIVDGHGRVFISPILDAGNGFPHAIEGFIGAVCCSGITSAVVECYDTDTGLPRGDVELDYVQVGAAIAVCYPDCDGSEGCGTLDIFDFLCFQNRYDAADPYACDCDTSSGPGVCDIFDFLCFQNAYDAGCP